MLSHANNAVWGDASPYLAVPAPRPSPHAQEFAAQLSALENRVAETLRQHDAESHAANQPERPAAVEIWGVPLAKMSLPETLTHIDHLIRSRQPGYFITANLNWVMLSHQRTDLQEVNRSASFITCDGMPLRWWSQLMGDPLPERVTGSDLIYAIAQWAASKRYRIFFLGGTPGVARTAARRLLLRYPGFEIAGIDAPPFRTLTATEQRRLVQCIRGTRPDVIFAALGQPKGELWIAELARGEEAVTAGETVTVQAVDGLTLKVKR